MKKDNILRFIAIAVLAIVAAVCVVHAFGDNTHEPEKEQPTEEKTTLPDGFYRNGENWCFFENGEASSKTEIIEGIVNEKEGLWKVVNGRVDFSLISLEKTENGTWQYVKNGEVTEETSDFLGQNENGYKKLDLSEIYAFIVENNKIYALLENEKFRIKTRLYKLEETLPKNYVKINQSTIIDIKKIDSFGSDFSGTLTVTLKNGYSDYVSRRNLKKVKERLGV